METDRDRNRETEEKERNAERRSGGTAGFAHLDEQQHFNP